jgi:hypothetical protein
VITERGHWIATLPGTVRPEPYLRGDVSDTQYIKLLSSAVTPLCTKDLVLKFVSYIPYPLSLINKQEDGESLPHHKPDRPFWNSHTKPR